MKVTLVSAIHLQEVELQETPADRQNSGGNPKTTMIFE